MKLTTREYMGVFGGTSLDQITKMCREGTLDAEKNEKGAWIINVEVPEEVVQAQKEAHELRMYADALYRKYRNVEHEIEKRMHVVIEFRKKEVHV